MFWLELIGATLVATALAIGAVHIVRYLVRRERGRELPPSAYDIRNYLADLEGRYSAPDYEAARKRFEEDYAKQQKEKGVPDADRETK